MTRKLFNCFARRVRRGQPAFRAKLLDAYEGRCAIFRMGAPPEVLEAAHILPHAETGLNELDNGLLLRSDLHSLFDAGTLQIDPSSMTVSISEDIRDTAYGEYDGKKLRPRLDGGYPSLTYLSKRMDRTSEPD